MFRHWKCPPLGHDSQSTKDASSSARPHTRHGVSSGGAINGAGRGGSGGRSIHPSGRDVTSFASASSASVAGMSAARAYPGPIASYGFVAHGARRHSAPTWWYGSVDSAARSLASTFRTNGSGSL